MPSLHEDFPDVREALALRYGAPAGHGVPTDPFEALVAIILEGPKRDVALAALRDNGLLEPQALSEADPAEVEEALRGAGLKVVRATLVSLQRVARWLVELHHGSADDLAGADSPVSSEQLRDELRAIRGIGATTADAILLFALRRPVYPLDRPTYRVLVRHGWLDTGSEYDEARDVVERLAADEPVELTRLAWWFERLGKDYCRASAAKCESCPLRPFLPEAGPIEPDAEA